MLQLCYVKKIVKGKIEKYSCIVLLILLLCAIKNRLYTSHQTVITVLYFSLIFFYILLYEIIQKIQSNLKNSPDNV